MAADPNPTISAELTAARIVLVPQIEGLGDFALTSVSAELKARLLEMRAARVQRDNFLVAALAARDAYIEALDVLEHDGYPALPTNVVLPNSLFAEMQEEQANLLAATKVVQVEMAAKLSIGLSAPVDKTAT